MAITDLQGRVLKPGGVEAGMNAVSQEALDNLIADPEFGWAVVNWLREMRSALERAGGDQEYGKCDWWSRPGWWAKAAVDAGEHLFDNRSMAGTFGFGDIDVSGGVELFEEVKALPDLNLGTIAQSLGLELCGLTGMKSLMFDAKPSAVIRRLGDTESWLVQMLREVG